MIRKTLMRIKQYLYLFVAADFICALIAGSHMNMKALNIKPISMIAVFIMLYPMLTGMAVERVKTATKNIKLIISTLFLAFIVASATAFLISRTLLAHEPDLALAMVLVGAIPCSNMLIGWTGIADASVEDAIVIAVAGLFLLPILSPILVRINGNAIIPIPTLRLAGNLLLYIVIPLVLGYITRKRIVAARGKPYFMELKKVFPGISATGILIIIFFSVAKVARIILHKPVLFLMVAAALFIYYLIQLTIAIIAARILRLPYEQGMILLLGATASSQAISLAIAATMFSSLTVFALSFKPLLQVFFILGVIYGLGPWLKRFWREESRQ
jgi:ACR3 family arsenite efflux pump ArsB